MAEVQNFEAAKALLVNADGKVLILREATTYEEGTNHGIYGLPGGRLEPEEDFDDGLRREVKEEIGITDFEILHIVHQAEWSPIIKGNQCHIVGKFVVCRLLGDADITLSSEHDEATWIDPKERRNYDIMSRDDIAIDNLVAYIEQLAN